MRRHLLRVLERAAVLQVDGDPGLYCSLSFYLYFLRLDLF